jgi:hypothetical protein
LHHAAVCRWTEVLGSEHLTTQGSTEEHGSCGSPAACCYILLPPFVVKQDRSWTGAIEVSGGGWRVQCIQQLYCELRPRQFFKN